ncbi:hypothetical protein FQN50_004810 [Emmonsiellopsis sp. PD_5]|nr:hypothetical protein FQN50_004810 [Emmonsiellopsis sp. PD_5]
MSLNGLDDPPVIESYQAALTEAGGWFLLKYVSRDTVAILSRGTGGVAEIRITIDGYDEKSPLYGFLHFRRRKIILKYVPDGVSRLIQARLSVQFQSILDKFSPHDTVFTLALSSELTENALSSICFLHTASGSMTSSSSSLRRRRLGEITEDAEESTTPKEETFAQADSGYENRRESMFSRTSEATAVPNHHSRGRDNNTTGNSSPRTDSTSRPSRDLSESRPDKPLPSVPRDRTGSQSSGVAQRHLIDHPAQPTESRKSSQSTRPSLRDLDTMSLYRPKVKLGPRPSMDPSGRPRTAGSMGRSTETRPVASLPAGVRMSTRKNGSSTGRPKSQPDIPVPRLPSSMAPPVPELLIPPPPLNIGPFSRNAPGSPRSVFSVPTSLSVAPEKQRLMRALELRKKQMEKSAGEAEKKKKNAIKSEPEEVTKKFDMEGNKENIEIVEVALTTTEPAQTDVAVIQPDADSPKQQHVTDTKPDRPPPPVPTGNEKKPTPPSPNPSNPDSDSAVDVRPPEPTTIPPVSPPPSATTNHSSGLADELPTPTQSIEPDPAEKFKVEEGDKDNEENTKEEEAGEPKVEMKIADDVSEPGQPDLEVVEIEPVNGTPKEMHVETEQPNNIEPLDATAKDIKSSEPETPADIKSSEPEAPAGIQSSEPETPADIKSSEPETPADIKSSELEIPAGLSSQEPTPRAIPIEHINGIVSVDSQPAPETLETSPAKPSQSDDATISPISQNPDVPAPPSVDGSKPKSDQGSDENEVVVTDNLKNRRKGLMDPIHIVTNIDESDEDNLLSDDSFMEELGSATFQEAKPIAVPKTPKGSTFAKRGDASSPADWATNRVVSTPTNAGYPGSDVQALPIGRSASGSYFENPKPVPVLVAKKVNVSSGISKRIKALEMFSSREGQQSLAPQPPAPTTSSSSSSPFEKFRKRASLSQSSLPPASSFRSKSPSYTPSPSSPEERSPVPSKRTEPQPTNIQSRSKSNSVSVTARIIRDPAAPVNDTPPDPSEPSVLNLQRSPLIVERDAPDSPPRPSTSTATRPEQRSLSMSSTGSGRPANNSAVPRSDSITSRLSASSWSKHEGHSPHASTDPPHSPLDRVDEGKEEKKESRKSRIIRRMSSITTNSRRGILNAISPTLKEEEVQVSPPKEEDLLPEPPQVVDIGEVNVQFPDTLLWKRRFMRIDDQGYLILTPGTIDGTARNIVKRYHLSEFRTPSLPDQDRQELPNSIVLDFQDGSTLQCACESRQGQSTILQTLLEAHRSYHHLYPQ